MGEKITNPCSEIPMKTFDELRQKMNINSIYGTIGNDFKYYDEMVVYKDVIMTSKERDLREMEDKLDELGL